MKAVKTITKILVALAAVAGAVYVIATYGDKIVAWAKNLLNSCKCCGGDCECECCCGCDCDCDDECECECAGECKCCCEAEEEAPAAEEAPVEEAPAEVADAVVADENDFEG